MSEQYKKEQLTSIEDARALVLENIDLASTESIDAFASVGRVLAQDVVSDIDITPFDNSAMDGFAVRFEDFDNVNPDKPLSLEIIGVLGAGSVYEGAVEPGEALRIMTGAPLPTGADTVVKIEDTQVLGESAETPFGTQVLFFTQPKQGDNVRLHGEEARKGELVLRTGNQISVAGVGLLASTGNVKVEVYSRPRVAILATGSELVEPTEVPGPGKIRNSNSHALAAAILDAGALPTILPPVGDTKEALGAALGEAAQTHDFVVLSGGAAEGDFDYTAPVVGELGEVFFTKVNMRPGKAQIFGKIDSAFIFGLPGNPAAALVGFELLVRPALRQVQGFSALERPTTQAVITTTLKKREPRRQYLRARLVKQTDGSYTVRPNKNQSSALFGAMNESNCLLIVPEGLDPLIEGTPATCVRIDIPEGTVL